MEKAVQKAAVNREVNNCVYNWTSDRITGRFATANEVKSVTSHEVINMIPDKGDLRMEDLAAVVRMINETEVLEEDVLSDRVYRYRRETGTVTLASGSERGLGEMA